jgi:hypothetical protein
MNIQKKFRFSKLLITFALLCSAGVPDAWAAADCKAYDKDDRLPEAEMKKRIESQGYKIKKFKIAGNCYEIYGWDKDGKKVEIYFDMKDGSVVKSQTH